MNSSVVDLDGVIEKLLDDPDDSDDNLDDRLLLFEIHKVIFIFFNC